MPSPRSAYDILGVPKTATTEEIKRKYRELARKYHPDVNPGNASAAQQFSQITQAYKTLSDSESRATYDAEQALQERRAAQATARAQARQTPPPTGNRPPTGQGSPTSNSRVAEAARLLTEARNAFQRGRFLEARSFAEQVIRITARNAEAYEILGDVYRIQGKNEQAMNMYSMALQINPRNYSVMQRLERVAQSAGMSSAPTADRIFFSNRTEPRDTYASPRYSSPAPTSGTTSTEKRGIGRLLVGFIGYAGVFLLVLFVALFHGDAPPKGAMLPFVSQWNATILAALAISGAVLGATMTITGAIRRVEDELILGGASGTGSRSYIPLGLLMVVVSVFSFYIAAIGYGIYAATQDAFTKSLQRVYGVVVAVVLALSAVYTPGHLQVLLWGGNVVFLAFVIGWLLGDFFRAE